MIELVQILLDINILPKFGADWSIYAVDSKQSQMLQFFLIMGR